MADMIIELIALLFVLIATCLYAQNDEEDSKNLIFVVMCAFAITDQILQIISLSTAGMIQTSMGSFQEAKCLDVTNVQGLTKHDVLTGLAGSVGLSFILGIVELTLTCIEMSCSTLEKCNRKLSSIGIVLLAVFQILETIMTVVDFFVVTTDAQLKSEMLFNTINTEGTYDEWCTSMVTNSTSCIAKKRGMTGTGSLSAGVTMHVSWLVVIVVSITTYWMVSDSASHHRQH